MQLFSLCAFITHTQAKTQRTSFESWLPHALPVKYHQVFIVMIQRNLKYSGKSLCTQWNTNLMPHDGKCGCWARNLASPKNVRQAGYAEEGHLRKGFGDTSNRN